MSTERQLAAVMFTDIFGYTSKMGNNLEKTLELVRISREIQKPLVEKYHGKWIKEMGDGVLARFNTALDAVNCALDIQKMARAELDAKLRIGIHLGDIVIENDDIYGDGVNVASRLESMADPGGIYLSNAVFQAIQGQSDVQTEFLGEVEFKNVAYSVRTYAVQGVGLPLPEYKEKGKVLKKGNPKKTTYTIVAALVLAVIGIFFIYLFPKLNVGGPEAEKPEAPSTLVYNPGINRSIAVLPFADMSPNGDQEWFSDGMMEEILNSLVQIEDLNVISRTTAMRYKGSEKSLKEIGKELGVAHILEGSVRRLDDQLRITVQLIDVESDLHLWSENYDRTMEDVFAIQSEVAQQIAASLHADISPETRLRIERQPTSVIGRCWIRWDFQNLIRGLNGCMVGFLKLFSEYRSPQSIVSAEFP